MFYWRVDDLGKGCGSLNMFGLRCILERIPGILRVRPWNLKLYDLRWWGPFGMVVCVRVLLLLEGISFVVGGNDCGVGRSEGF